MSNDEVGNKKETYLISKEETLENLLHIELKLLSFKKKKEKRRTKNYLKFLNYYVTLEGGIQRKYIVHFTFYFMNSINSKLK